LALLFLLPVLAAATPPAPDLLPHAPALRPEGRLSLEKALEAALLGNPQLLAAAWEVRAVEARREQAGLRPNPELGLEAENLGGGALARDGRESTLSVTWPFELGGKRTARLRLAGAERNLAAWDYETRRADLIAEVRKAFAVALGAQVQTTLAGENVRLAARALGAVDRQVRAGSVSPTERIRAEVASAEAEVEHGRARSQLDSARVLLARTWGASQAAFESVTGTLELELEPPELPALTDRIAGNPDLARWESELERRQASLALQRSAASQDLGLLAGLRHLSPAGATDDTLIVGLTMPLPFRNRNQGAIREARTRVSQAQVEQAAAFNRTGSLLATAHRDLTVAAAQVKAYRTQILPGAQAAFEALETGYRAGRFGFLDLLDTQRSLGQARLKYAEVLVELHLSVAEVERLIGAPLQTVGVSGLSPEVRP
jgi:cobalt-zinc-cadmium efflux system outer membrane protein